MATLVRITWIAFIGLLMFIPSFGQIGEGEVSDSSRSHLKKQVEIIEQGALEGQSIIRKHKQAYSPVTSATDSLNDRLSTSANHLDPLKQALQQKIDSIGKFSISDPIYSKMLDSLNRLSGLAEINRQQQQLRQVHKQVAGIKKFPRHYVYHKESKVLYHFTPSKSNIYIRKIQNASDFHRHLGF